LKNEAKAGPLTAAVLSANTVPTRPARVIKSLHFLAFGATPMCIALADDGTVWQAYVAPGHDGITFRYPSALAPGNEVGDMPPGWIECGACVLPQREVRAEAIAPEWRPAPMPQPEGKQ
jgi:hypothetical protein